MFQVALCEDEKAFAETEERLCREILGRMNIEYGVTVFDGSRAFIAAFFDGGKRYDLILLDIVMDGMSGMDLAKKIREADSSAGIAFITGSREYAIEGYSVRALRYLTKPVDAVSLERLIKGVYEEKYVSNYYILRTGTQHLRIAVKDMVSLETYGRKVEITTKDGAFHYSGKLMDLLEELPKGWFVRCHQAYAVNINNIWELDRSEAVAVNGKRIPVSRAYLRDVQTAFLTVLQLR